jgi:hypothetical protein
VAIIDAVSVGLCILAITPLISLYTLDVGRLYAGHLIWGRSFVRLVLAGVLFYLRAEKDGLETCQEFLKNAVRGRGRDVA